MKIQFDAKQPYQIDAVAAVLDLFDGQPLEPPDYAVIFQTMDTELFGGQTRTELGLGNALRLNAATLHRNTRAVQERNEIEVARPGDALAVQSTDGKAATIAWDCPQFSVEMETGTGKTYVYLRTIYELHRKYGFKKFVVVVPSVAIREGVLKNLEITREHFAALYNQVEAESFVYDSRKVNRLRQFAVSNAVQIMVINIDAFKNDATVIKNPNDRLSGRAPLEFVQAVRPVVIIDEPQSVDGTERAQTAVQSLRPLCCLRYSATHRHPYELVYKLDPIRAYQMRLVKGIVVASVTAGSAQNDAYVKVASIDHKKGIKAKLLIHTQGAAGVKAKPVTVTSRADLFVLSEGREAYRDGYVVTEINATPGEEFVQFNNGRRLGLGQEQGGVRADIQKEQIRRTVEKHLEKERQLQGRGLKVLTLFFIDRVANYRAYDEEGRAAAGMFAREFEAAYRTLAAEERFGGVAWTGPVEALHDGYFAKDKKGVVKDTNGATLADDDVYNLIMRDKERLLSMEEPLRFLFSHSALREGWDNPNVFQICTLNETGSMTKKRQELGRGLRLPVNQDGERVVDENINKLTVVANESYEEFARGLQTEYEQDCGVTFGKVGKGVFAKLVVGEGEAGEARLLGREKSAAVWEELVRHGWVDAQGRITGKFAAAKAEEMDLGLPEELAHLKGEVVDVLRSYQTERFVQREEDGKKLRFKKDVSLTPEFAELWRRIQPKTRFSVAYPTEELIAAAARSIGKMAAVQPVTVTFNESRVDLTNRGVVATVLRQGEQQVVFRGELPNLIAYLQNETELTRSTIVRTLVGSGRLDEFLVNPQAFLDAVTAILKNELHRFMIDGIKYERIDGQEWSVRQFEDKEIIGYLNNRLEVRHSIYDAVIYDSEVERAFAEKLDEREDIKLFVKLPAWFQIDTPIGTYNPDWAILKHDAATLYLVRETKGTKDFLKLRNSEADKVRCGKRHFEALDIDFKVVVTADEV